MHVSLVLLFQLIPDLDTPRQRARFSLFIRVGFYQFLPVLGPQRHQRRELHADRNDHDNCSKVGRSRSRAAGPNVRPVGNPRTERSFNIVSRNFTPPSALPEELTTNVVFHHFARLCLQPGKPDAAARDSSRSISRLASIGTLSVS
jgi:hypothetical protein